MNDLSPLLSVCVYTAFSILGVSLLMSLYRVARGPSLPDRVVALDLVALLVVGLIVVDAVFIGQAHFLRAGIALALVAFLGTVAFAYYLRKMYKR